jgi:hypothetical protein
MADQTLEPLFEPITLGNVTLRNRFVMPAMQIGFTENCGPSLRTIDYLRGRAEGGAGLIFSESCAPDHPSGYWQAAFCVMNAQTRGRWAQLSDAIKGAGSAFAMQLWHPGSQRQPIAGFAHADAPTLSPSGLIQKDRESGQAMTRDEMDDIAAAFVRAAEDANCIARMAISWTSFCGPRPMCARMAMVAHRWRIGRASRSPSRLRSDRRLAPISCFRCVSRSSRKSIMARGCSRHPKSWRNSVR